MNEDDPFDALSAAMREKALRRPVPRPKPAGSRTSLLVMLFIGLGILAVGIPVGIILTLRLAAMPSEPPAKQVIIVEKHPPGELAENVPAAPATSKPATPPATTEDSPPPDPP